MRRRRVFVVQHVLVCCISEVVAVVVVVCLVCLWDLSQHKLNQTPLFPAAHCGCPQRACSTSLSVKDVDVYWGWVTSFIILRDVDAYWGWVTSLIILRDADA